jgi:hypothetical protein
VDKLELELLIEPSRSLDMLKPAIARYRFLRVKLLILMDDLGGLLVKFANGWRQV